MAEPLRTAPLRIALAGLGTVGAGLVRLVEANGELIARRAGREVRIVAVSARDRNKDRGVDLSRYAWEDDMTALAAREDVDVVVELVGGADGPALTTARNALKCGKALVTANKAMIAHHGLELAELAEANAAPLRFEAAVAGGIPVIKGLREGAAANRIERIYGILNGTCNYILSTMEQTGRDFAEVLAEAQALGYARPIRPSTSKGSMRRTSSPSSPPSPSGRGSTFRRSTSAGSAGCARPTSPRPKRSATASA
jgi:homoserine dehydrogenase